MMFLLTCLPVWGQEPPMSPVEDLEPEAASMGPDRSKKPDVGLPVPIAIDDVTVHTLSGGLTVRHVRVPRARKAKLEITWWKGRENLDVDPWVVRRFAEQWGVSSESYDSEALEQLEDRFDLTVYGNVGSFSSYVVMEAPLDELVRGVDLMADVTFRPTFEKKIVQQSIADELRYYDSVGPTSPSRVAQQALTYAWTPADHPYGQRPDLDAIASVSWKSLPDAHRAVLALQPVTLEVIADVDWSELEPLLNERFGGLTSKKMERAVLPEPPSRVGTRVVAVELPEGEQALIRMRRVAPKRSHPDRAGMRANAWALGGHFLSRLNSNLREDKGWTYGVRAGYSSGVTSGSFSMSVDVPIDKAAPAIRELESELAKVVDEGLTEDELDAWWRGSVKDFNDTRATLSSASAFYGSRDFHQETVADAVAWLDTIDGVQRSDASRAAKTWFGDDAPTLWVIVGPRPGIEAALEDLGWKATWVTPEQAIEGTFDGGLKAK